MRSRLSVLSAFALCAILLTSTRAFAQGTTYGVQGGINISNVSFKAGDSSEEVPDFKSRTRGVFGGFVARDFNPKVGLQVDVLYTQKGTQADAVEDGFAFHIEIGADYIEIPVLIRGNIPGSGKVKARVFAGPSFGIKVHDKAKLSGGGMVLEGDDVAEFKSGDAGFVLGGAVQFGQVFVDLRYNWGFVNIVKDDGTGDEAKTRTFGIMIGFQIK
jgi:hypothetical protein